jgi:rubrerythrin
MVTTDAELATAGSLFRFAVELEGAAQRFYGALAAGSHPAPQSKAFASLEKSHGKQQKKLQRMQQEQLSELILEPISGMNAATYFVELGDAAQLSTKEALARARQLEETLSRFFADAASRGANALGAQVVRSFQRLAQSDRAAQLHVIKEQ